MIFFAQKPCFLNRKTLFVVGMECNLMIYDWIDVFDISKKAIDGSFEKRVVFKRVFFEKDDSWM